MILVANTRVFLCIGNRPDSEAHFTIPSRTPMGGETADYTRTPSDPVELMEPFLSTPSILKNENRTALDSVPVPALHSKSVAIQNAGGFEQRGWPENAPLREASCLTRPSWASESSMTPDPASSSRNYVLSSQVPWKLL